MLIKKIIKGCEEYYILFIYDKKNCCWSSCFLREKQALLLLETGVKLIVKEV